MQGGFGIWKSNYQNMEGDFNVMVMELLGPILEKFTILKFYQNMELLDTSLEQLTKSKFYGKMQGGNSNHQMMWMIATIANSFTKLSTKAL